LFLAEFWVSLTSTVSRIIDKKVAMKYLAYSYTKNYHFSLVLCSAVLRLEIV